MPTAASLTVIVLILVAAIVFSVRKTRRLEAEAQAAAGESVEGAE